MSIPQSLPEVQAHLLAVRQNASVKLDSNLLELFAAQVTADTDRDVIDRLLSTISTLIPFLQQDPTPLAALVAKVTSLQGYTFMNIINIDPPFDFVAGLCIASQPINLVTLTLLEKATASASSAMIVAGKPGIVAALVRLWLTTPFTDVAQEAGKVLWGLLNVDHCKTMAQDERTGPTKIEEIHNQRLMWRRIFNDKEIYGSIFNICSLKTRDGTLGTREKSLAQARLMDILVKIAKADWVKISESQIPEVETAYGVENGGLLQFAAIKMIDSGDLLMKMSLTSFYTQLLAVFSSEDVPLLVEHPRFTPIKSSPALEFLVESGIHDNILSTYMDPGNQLDYETDHMNSSFVKYIAMYSECYPYHFVETVNVPDLLMQLTQKLQYEIMLEIQGQMRHDLHLLASIPRTTLVSPLSIAPSPIPVLRSRPANADIFLTLACLFHGPERLDQNNVSPDHFQLNQNEAAAARALYFAYIKKNPNLWKDVVVAADTIVLTDAALAAISLISAVITATWAPLPEESVNTNSRCPLPTERDLATFTQQDLVPYSPVLAIFEPPALDSVVPYLLAPPRTFSSQVGGGYEDEESPARKTATQRYGAVVHLLGELKRISGICPQNLQPIISALEERTRQGPWGQNGVGGRISTLNV